VRANIPQKNSLLAGSPVLLFIILFSLSFCANAQPTNAPFTFRVMTYNIQHGAGADEKIDLLRTAQAIKHEKPDIVALEEVDNGVERTARRDLTAELAAMTEMTGYFSNNFNFQGGLYGNAVLTRFPILSATNTHYQMLRPKEQRGIIQLILDVHGRKILFMATHIDYRKDNAERLMNVAEIKRIIAQYPGLPMILCGDFNDFPNTPVHKAMQETFDDTWELIGHGDGFTFPSPKPNRRIDYIWLGKDKSVVPIKAWVPDTQASDHRPFVADFELK
jgi:endonuclease/exonuclease/phosphatase family metal-dependent hydrolase